MEHRLNSSPFRRIVVVSRTIARIPHLASFFPDSELLPLHAWSRNGVDAIAGWALKRSGRVARSLAALSGVPYLALEDGFVGASLPERSSAGRASLIVDPVGIYHDARAPSALERLLQTDGWISASLLREAEECIAFKKAHRLSKYNNAPDAALGPRTRRRILVLDQLRGDASIRGGLATPRRFSAMLAAAVAQAGDRDIWVKRHPVGGARRGCLDLAEHRSKIAGVLEDACDPISLFEQVDEVYTVSSLAGFEALLAGVPVRCFGLPFYAAWGATRDELNCSRRTKRRSVVEMFAAAYLNYSRYVDPLSGAPCALRTAMERLATLRAPDNAKSRHYACVRIEPWKREAIRGATGNRVSFHLTVRAAQRRARKTGGCVVVWASREPASLARRMREANLPLVRAEDGFIRSVGLGAQFHKASSFVFDEIGIYFDARRPSRLERILEETEFSASDLARAAQLRARIVAASVSKYNLPRSADNPFAFAQGKAAVLVVGQVENDASIRFSDGSVRTNLELLAAVRRDNPDAFIVYKAHPDVVAGRRRGRVRTADVLCHADAVADGLDISGYLASASVVHTMTSLSGFETLLRGKPVHVWGQPFYAGWGLTEDRLPIPRRRRRLTLDMLVAGALLHYPVYLDPGTRARCSPELLIDRICKVRQ